MFWKILFWITFYLFPSQYSDLSKYFPYCILDLVISIPSVIGIFLYAYRIRLFTAILWQAYFFISLIWSIAYSFFTFPPMEHTNAYWVGMGIGILLIVLNYIGLYLYSFKYLPTEEIVANKKSSNLLRYVIFFLFFLVQASPKKGPSYFITLFILASLYVITLREYYSNPQTRAINKMGYDQRRRIRARSMGTLACVLIMIIMLILPAMSLFTLFLNTSLKVHWAGVMGLLIGVPVLVISISQVQYSLKDDLEFRTIYRRSIILGALLIAILSLGEYAFIKMGGVNAVVFFKENAFVDQMLSFYNQGDDKAIFRDNVTSRFRSSSDFDTFQKTMADTRQVLGEYLSKKEVFEFRERYTGDSSVFYRLAFDVHHKGGVARHYFTVMFDGKKLLIDGWAVRKDGQFLFAQGNLYDMPLEPKGIKALMSDIPKALLKDVRTDYLEKK